MKKVDLLPALRTAPAVFAVGKTYQILVPVNCDVLFWVRVGDTDYFDHSNGILRSAVRMHRVSVPTEVLDRAGAYTVCYRKIVERKPYFSETEEPVSATYPFRPVPGEGPIRIVHLADTHNERALSSEMARHFGDDLDLFVLNGDIPNHSGAIEYFDLIYQLCETATQGQRTCVFSRGNHDTRGIYAENIAEYTPVENGRSYYTFRVGSLWGIVMDCGEDKADSHAEYGNTVCCEAFRREESAFLRDVVRRAGEEYDAPGVRHKIVIVHNPFGHTLPAPFDIEGERYREWIGVLNGEIKPKFMLSGHLHRIGIFEPEDEFNDRGLACKAVLGSAMEKDGHGGLASFTGAAIVWDGDEPEIEFVTARKTVLDK